MSHGSPLPFTGLGLPLTTTVAGAVTAVTSGAIITVAARRRAAAAGPRVETPAGEAAAEADGG